MATATQFFEFWGLSFLTLSVALLLLELYFRFVDSGLDLHSFWKEAMIAGVASAVQGAGWWFSASLYHGDPWRRLTIPGVLVGFIYWVAHFEDWSGYEIGGILFFQMGILTIGACAFGGDLKMAAILLVVFAIALALHASITKSL